MSFFSPKSELALVFDIGSSSVGAALVRLTHGEPLSVLHTLREAIPYQERIEPDRLFKDMVDVLTRVHANIIREGATRLSGTEFKHVKIHRVFYSFASPWSATQTKTLSIKKDKAFVFTHDLLNSLMLDEDEKFKKEALGSQRVFQEALSVIERRIIQTKLNGYDIKDPFDKKVREADVSYFTGIVPKSVLEMTMEVSHGAHISKNIKSFTFPLAAFGTIQSAFPNEIDYIHLRIGGEISDVSIVEDGLISESASFPKGQNHIVRALGAEMNMTKEETLSFLKLYAEAHADADTVQKFEPVIMRLINEWIESLRTVLEKLQSGMFLPQKLFLVMDGDISSLFIKALETEPAKANGILRGPFSVTMISPDVLAGSVSFKSEKKDSPLALISGFAKRIYESERR